MTDAFDKIADAIVDELNAASDASTFDLQFRAEVSYLDFDLPLTGEDDNEEEESAELLHVDVVPAGLPTSEDLDRSGISDVIDTDVVVRRRFGPEERDTRGRVNRDAIARLGKLVCDIKNHFADPDNNQLTGYVAAEWEGVSVPALYTPRHLREYSQFTGVVRIQYRVWNDLG